MYNIGDLVIYSVQGICKIDDICEKTVLGIKRSYYVLHPVDNDHQLTISIPVNSDKVVLLEPIHKEEASEILESFKYPGVEWNNKPNIRFKLFSDIVSKGDRKEIAKVINTLMRKKMEANRQEKKINEHDRKFLNHTRNILFKEIALTMNTSVEKINELVIGFIMENEVG